MKKSLKLLSIVLVVMLLLSIVIKGVDNSWGSVTVKQGKSLSPNGYLMSYKIYIPKSATPAHPAPALVYMVGGGSSLDESSMIAVEASRRGYIVIVTDVPGNGMSEPIISAVGGLAGSDEAVPVNSMEEGLAYTAASIEIIKSLPVADTSQIVLAGHSMGGYYTSIVAQQYADEVSACIALGTFGFSGNVEEPTDFNFALVIGQGDESILYRTTGYNTLSDAVQSPGLKTLFGVPEDQEIEVGKVYGDYADETARVVYTPNTMHMMEPDTPAVCKIFLNELTASTTAPNPIDNGSFVFWIKDLAMLLVLLSFALLIYAVAQLLLDTQFFSSLILQGESRYIGFKPKTAPWFVGVVALSLICGALYILCYQHYSEFPIVAELGNAGGKCLWSVGTGILLAIYLIIFHFTYGKKQKATAADYGLSTSSNGGFKPVYILKSLLFAFTVFAVIYGVYALYTTFTGCNVHVVLFNNELALLEPTKVRYKYLSVLLCMYVFIFVNAIAQKTIVGSDGKMGKELVLTNFVGTIGMLVQFVAFVIGLLGPHVCLFAANRGCFGAETLLGVSVCFWMINLTCYHLIKKTKSVWAGTMTAAVIMTWLCIYATGMNF